MRRFGESDPRELIEVDVKHGTSIQNEAHSRDRIHRRTPSRLDSAKIKALSHVVLEVRVPEVHFARHILHALQAVGHLSGSTSSLVTRIGLLRVLPGRRSGLRRLGRRVLFGIFGKLHVLERRKRRVGADMVIGVIPT